MIRPARRILALVRFSVASTYRSGLTIGGLLLGVTVMVLGPVVGVLNDLAWGFDSAFGLIGFLVMALFALRSGLEEQRELGLVVFLRHNLMGAAEHAAGMVAAVTASWAVLCASTFVAIVLVSAGDVRAAAWYTAAWGVRSLLLVGFVPLVERVASFRLPFLVPVLAYVILLVALSLVLQDARAIAYFVPVERGDMDALIRLCGQAAVAFPATAVLSFGVLAVSFTPGPAGRFTGRRAGRFSIRGLLGRIVPFRH